MRRNDIILIIIIIIVALSGMVALFFLQSQTGSIALVSYRDQPIIQIDLTDGSYEILDASRVFQPGSNESNPIYRRCFNEAEITCVMGELGVVVIEYDAGRVRVIEETSPQNICQLQGFTDSPFHPLTCLPNYVVITVISDEENEDDFIT